LGEKSPGAGSNPSGQPLDWAMQYEKEADILALINYICDEMEIGTKLFWVNSYIVEIVKKSF
jgi:hypothetical protein